MIYEEKKQDLFSVDFNVWTPAHCISLDCKMSAGIAVPMKEKFKLHDLSTVILNNYYIPIEVRVAVYYNKVYNLITKSKYWHKPTLDNLQKTLVSMIAHAKTNGITKIVMPRIGSGLDGLNWIDVQDMLLDLIAPTDLHILVCYL